MDTIEIQTPRASLKTRLFSNEMDELISFIAREPSRAVQGPRTVSYADQGVDRAKARELRRAISRQERRALMAEVR